MRVPHGKASVSGGTLSARRTLVPAAGSPVCARRLLCQPVGLLDIDICGPSVPKLVGLEGEEIHRSNAGWSPVYVEDNLAVMSIGFLLPNPDDAVIWRGPRKNGLIKQFLKARAAGGRPGVVRVGPGVGVAWRLARVGAWLAHRRSGPAGSRCPKLTMRRPARLAHQHPCSSSSSARPDSRGVVREERCYRATCAYGGSSLLHVLWPAHSTQMHVVITTWIAAARAGS